jgi:ADP-heptose:LPS heptosyltransferase
LGVPTIAVFGPTDPRVWAPRGQRVEVLWAGPDALTLSPADALARVTAEDVLEALRPWLT